MFGGEGNEMRKTGEESRPLRLLQCPSCRRLSFPFNFCNRHDCLFILISQPWHEQYICASVSQRSKKQRPDRPFGPGLKCAVASDFSYA